MRASRRRFVTALALGGLAPRVLAQARSPLRLGILTPGQKSVETRLWTTMLQHLAALGHREGTNLSVEWRFAERDLAKLPALARELVAARCQVVATMGTRATRAQQQASAAVGVVSAGVADPILGGFAQTLARPGRNVTGLCAGDSDTAGLQVGLLRQVSPRITQLSVITGAESSEQEVVAPIVAAARKLQLESSHVVVRDPAGAEAALRKLRDSGAAFVFQADGVDEREFAQAAVRHRVATQFVDRDWVAAGGLMAYSLYHQDRMRRVAVLVDKVLRGAPAGDQPFELPAHSHFSINLRTASALGLAIPQEVLLRADELIE
jgi:putative ABC transport system substrate-binding protein